MAHFLMVPYIEQGHINPMLSLASHLVALGCRVTFVSKGGGAQAAANGGANEQNGGGAEEERCSKAGAEEERMQFVTAAGPAKRDGEREGVQTFKKQLEGLEEMWKPLIARLLHESLASAHPISGIISDFLLWKWMSPLALSLSIPLAVLHVCSASFFYILHLQHKGNYPEIEDLLVSGFGLPTSEFFDGIVSSKDAPEVTKTTSNFFHSLFEGFEDAGHSIFVNSFKHLEAPLLPFLDTSRLDFKFVGPCFPTWSRDHVGIGGNLGNIMTQRAGSAFSEDYACMSWLDKQEKGSVLFVSFGSEATMKGEEQMVELTMGIEKSGYKFLWVVRPGAKASTQPPEAFCERIKREGGERGMFASWVPQKRVLQHPAVGGFLTHSGWNSTIESVAYGAPMLCLPFFGDHPLNANLVQWYWKVGLRLGPTKSGLVEQEEVESGVRALFMQGRSRVAHFQQAAQSAIADAHHTLSSFVQAFK